MLTKIRGHGGGKPCLGRKACLSYRKWGSESGQMWQCRCASSSSSSRQTPRRRRVTMNVGGGRPVVTVWATQNACGAWTMPKRSILCPGASDGTASVCTLYSMPSRRRGAGGGFYYYYLKVYSSRQIAMKREEGDANYMHISHETLS